MGTPETLRVAEEPEHIVSLLTVGVGMGFTIILTSVEAVQPFELVTVKV